jgi:uncharacterized protein YdeI (YjbR/CyaY-like superfamily)
MSSNKILSGTVHKIPKDLKEKILLNSKLLLNWNSLTTLARNEWICWLISVKKQETRYDHLRRIVLEVEQGKKRPCCWIGCIHRKDKKLSPSVKYVIKYKE